MNEEEVQYEQYCKVYARQHNISLEEGMHLALEGNIELKEQRKNLGICKDNIKELNMVLESEKIFFQVLIIKLQEVINNEFIFKKIFI